MSWADDVVRRRGEEPREEDWVAANLDIAARARSYEEYVVRCTLAGVEVLFTRADFEGGGTWQRERL